MFAVAFSLFVLHFVTRYALLTGVITSYGLWMDGVLVFNSSSSQRFFIVEGLSPWSRHVVRLQACTAQGCGKGPLVSESFIYKPTQGRTLKNIFSASNCNKGLGLT